MQTVLCKVTAWLRLTVQRRQKSTVSFRTEATRSVGGWGAKVTLYVPLCQRPLRQEREYHQLPASTQQKTAKNIVTKKRDEYLEFGQILRNLPRASGRSTTSRITHIAHGAGIARGAVDPHDLTEGGQTLTGSSARDECPPSV